MKLLASAMLITAAAAQTLLPARPGVILYHEGEVSLDGQAMGVSPLRWPEMRQNGVLTSGKGRAEVLLNPCSLLHLGEHSALRMVVNSLTGARLELLAGSAMAEADGGKRTGIVEISVGGSTVRLARAGVYRFDSEPARLRVYYGVAAIDGAGRLDAGKSIALGAGAAVKFDRKQTDALQEWNDLRVRQLMDESGIPPLFGRPRICATQ